MSAPRFATTRIWSFPALAEQWTESRSRLAEAMPIGVTGLLLFGPIAFGGVEEWALLILRAGAALFFFAWCLQQVSKQKVEVVSNPLYMPAMAFGTVVLIQVIFRRSEYIYASTNEALNFAAYGLLLFLGVQYFQHRSDLRRLAIAFTSFGFVFSVFAIMQSFSGTQKLYWVRLPYSINSAIFGSYVNHNHYAGLMELLIPFPLLLSLGGAWRGAKRILCAFAAVLMCSSLFLSKSRGGMIAFVVQLMFVASIAVHRRSKKLAGSLGIACLAMVGLLTWLDASGMIRERVTSLANPLEAAGIRMTILQDGLRMFQSKPILGWGLETFPVVYPKYRSFSTDMFVNEAHNDYLQLLVETGAIGFLIALWFIYHLFEMGLPHRRAWTHDLKSAVRMAALVGCTGILIHSFFDFNLHIPANAALFFFCAALATSGQSPLSRMSAESGGH